MPLHPIDLWTYDHVGRMPPLRPLAEDLAEGPQFAAEAFVKIARDRLELVTADVEARGLGDVPALVEGPQLFPSMADEVAAAVWLVPDAEQTRRAREQRLARRRTRRAGLGWTACWHGTPYWPTSYGVRRRSAGGSSSTCRRIRIGRRSRVLSRTR